MNTIWGSLGIDETDDSKVIKRAYAKRLKQFRPDEKPEEFQQLHQSYKYALQHARYVAAQAKSNQDNLIDIDFNVSNEQDVSALGILQQNDTITHAPKQSGSVERETPDVDSGDHRYSAGLLPKQDVISPDEIYKSEIDRMMSKVEDILAQDSRYTIEQWECITESEYMLDPEFNWDIGTTLLNRIIQYYNDQEYREHGDFRLTLAVLLYLNDLFRWSENGIDLQASVDDDYGKRIFTKLADADYFSAGDDNNAIAGLRGSKTIKKVRSQSRAPLKNLYYGDWGKRLVAMAIDLFAITPLAILFNWTIEPFIKDNATQASYISAYFMFGIYLLGAWLFECSKYQATPGKFILGLRVTNRHQEKLSYYHGLLRTLVFSITCIGSYFTALINSCLGGNFIHDRLTKSYVIDYRSSRNKQGDNYRSGPHP